MRFTWHERKREITRQRRGLDFADAEQVFAGPTITFEDDRVGYGETRWVTLGVLRDRVVVIVHTESDDEIQTPDQLHYSPQRCARRTLPAARDRPVNRHHPHPAAGGKLAQAHLA